MISEDSLYIGNVFTKLNISQKEQQTKTVEHSHENVGNKSFQPNVRRINNWVNKEGFFAYILGQTIKRFWFAFCYIVAQITSNGFILDYRIGVQVR